MSTDPALSRLSQPPGAHGRPELRVHRRYPIILAVQYKCNHRRAQQRGSGTTINISSGGILFRSAEMLPLQSLIELALSWPVPLNDCPLKLVMRGRVVRSASEATAVSVLHYEFRTAGRLASGPSL
jgi:c-di-GMP-binding flagellar brake protein YcgR